MRIFTLLVGAGSFAVTVVLAGGCSSPPSMGGQGASCEQPSDCATNLYCVPQSNGTRICSNNLGPIQHTEEAGADARSSKGADGAVASDAHSGGQDATSQDTGAGPPGKDGGAASDAGLEASTD